MDELKGSLIDKNTLMVIGQQSGEPVGHITEFPGLYESITSIDADPATGLEGMVNVSFVGEVECPECGSLSMIGYVCTDDLRWSITFCRVDGIVWRKKEVDLH